MRRACLLVVAAGSAASAAPRLQPRIVTPPPDRDCPLAWADLDAPARIPLNAEGCDAFDPASLFQSCTIGEGVPGEPHAVRDCELGTMRGGTHAAVQAIGPSGSGHFWSVVIALDTPAHPHACFEASTVGFRTLAPVAGQVPPVKWFVDLNGNGERELILWERLSWGNYETANALFPIVYVLDGTELVRRDDLAAGLRAKIAVAYRNLQLIDSPRSDAACLRAVTAALEAR